MQSLSTRARALLAALLVVLVGGGTVALVVDPEDEGGADRSTISFNVDGPDEDLKADDTVVAGGQAPDLLNEIQAAPEKFDIGDNLRGQDVTPEGRVDAPLATPEWPGCKTRFTPVNFSNRTASIRGFGFHYTGSRNVPGWADMNSLAAYSSSRSAGVSWHFLIDREGHCYYQVPVSKKAWTIGNLNSETINVEMIGNGSEGNYGGTAGFNKLRAIVRRAGNIYGFPVKLGRVSNCHITNKGIITHWMGGSCAGGHVDIKPFDIAAVAKRMGADPCNLTCQRRTRHAKAHRAFRSRRCGSPPKSAGCKTLQRQLNALHKTGVKFR